MNPQNSFIPSPAARKSLAKKLNLQFNEDMQDWEWEISNPARIHGFIEEYDKPGTSDEEKMSLMEILLDSLNDLLLDKNKIEFHKHFHLVQTRLIENDRLHQKTLNYWTKNYFEISTELKNALIG